MFFRISSRSVTGSLAVTALAFAANAMGADLTITDAGIVAGKLVIAGTTVSPNTWVRLDGQTGPAFNVKSNANSEFGFAVIYHPGDCIVGLQKLISPTTLGPETEALVADCGPRALSPRGVWNASSNYLAEDLVISQGASWRAKRGNINSTPAKISLDWERFADSSSTSPASSEAASGSSEVSLGATPSVDVAPMVAPTGPAGGDLAGNYPNPTIKAGGVTTGRIADHAVSGSKMAVGAVTTNKIADGAVTSAKVLDDTQAGGGLSAADLAPDSVGSAEIATDAVNATEIANDSIDSGEIVDFGLSNQDIGVLFAQVNADATIANSSGGVTAADLGAGTYEVDFGRDISSCAVVMTQGEAGTGGAGGAITGVTDRAGNLEAVFATTRTDANALADRAFQLVVVC